ncbi:cobalamin biosynthesis protein [Cypionkella sp.]|uniref:cobalamin biosynthesis protein n=1 Tax=Cypionkella sp. TaxID=2811411 RepID=UPI002AB9D537|nr:cobalamin biosynthesis protein [Cypionkella sp.]MDZ4391956.1 cobalamin biosynthesis protein [Cypionkella sp.]
MIVAGLGFRKDAGIESLRDALRAAGGDNAHALATAEDKAAAAVIQALAAELALPLHAIPVESLRNQPTLTQSARVQARYGTGSLAEAAALAAAGPGARLLGPRVTSQDGRATAALAERNSS